MTNSNSPVNEQQRRFGRNFRWYHLITAENSKFVVQSSSQKSQNGGRVRTSKDMKTIKTDSSPVLLSSILDVFVKDYRH